ncbi:MAG: MFS transporter [Candidatus Nephthysia bennettiae]|nr:MAG: MFS transporter [Candidatus Dormibacteraeota bacterium]
MQGAAAGPAGPALQYSTAAGRWVIAAAILGSGVAALDSTVVNIALPAIGREFAAGVEDLQWVATGYLLTLAGLLLLGGALGDRYGRKRVFLVGVIWFGLASLLCGVAPNVTALIAARALQGIGGALLTPGSLAILEASFEPRDRAKAIGAWSGLGGIATAVGPFLGGYLIAAVSWRLIFLINLPLIAAVVVISLRHVPESHDPAARGRLDVLGAVLATVGLGGLCYGLIEWPALGSSSPLVLGALGLGLTSLALFILVEARVSRPLLPLALFRSRQFTAANLVTLVVYGALGGGLFLLPIELQQVAHYSPLAAGTALLPITVIMLFLSARSGALASRIGPRLQMSVGPLIVAAGLLLLARIDASGSYLLEVLPAMLVFGLGLACTVAPLTSTVLDAAPTEEAGVASAINNDVARAASLLAVAVLPSAAGITGASYLHPDQLSEGFRHAVFIAAALCACGGLLGALTIQNPPRPRVTPSGPGVLGERHSSHCALDAPPLRPRVRV